MDAINVGWLSLLPPIVAIILALWTKEVLSSLFVGILVGTTIYSIKVGTGFAGIFSSAFTLMGNCLADNILNIIFLTLLGAVVVEVTVAGGAQAYGVWASKHIKSPQAAQLATCILGVLIFIDDYFNCLAVGTIMKPVTDRFNISRAKLAYFIDSTAAPVCIIAPVSSWVAAVASNLSQSGAFKSEMGAFVATIPFNLYALLTITMVITLSLTHISYGPMRKLEHMADMGNIDATEKDSDMGIEVSENGTVKDLVLPILALVIFTILAMLYTGGMFSGKGIGFRAAFGNCSTSLSLVLGSFSGLVVTLIMYLPRKLMNFNDFFNGVVLGGKNMVMPNMILCLAWTLSGICRQLLNTGTYVAHLVSVSHFPLAFIPAMIFVVACALAFATGTSWGTFGILIPIVISILQSTMSTEPSLMTVALAACLGGAVFGDHCSPISDTTIMSSAGAACPHIDHVSTQIPYALTAASGCLVGYIVSGITHEFLPAVLISAFATLFILMNVFSKIAAKKPLEDETAAA